jgi:septal ring factor EnvC (AmiA/AmiB activator)
MKKALLLPFLLFGCAAPNQATHDDINQLREELRAIRASIESLNKDMADTRVRVEALSVQQTREVPALEQRSGLTPVLPQKQGVNDATKAATKVSTPQPADKAVGTTSKGATIYQGPRGGLYHLSPSGNKVYEKKKK